MANLAELVKQREKLDEEIEKARKDARADDLAQVKETIKLHSFTLTELRSAITMRKRKRKVKATTEAESVSS